MFFGVTFSKGEFPRGPNISWSEMTSMVTVRTEKLQGPFSLGQLSACQEWNNLSQNSESSHSSNVLGPSWFAIVVTSWIGRPSQITEVSKLEDGSRICQSYCKVDSREVGDFRIVTLDAPFSLKKAAYPRPIFQSRYDYIRNFLLIGRTRSSLAD
jgi:hypothetical protein